MPKPFKFRYVNQIAGAFVLVILLLLVVGILLAGHAQRWFEPVYEVMLMFPPEGSLDLQKGAEVHILGTVVGSVSDITVQDDGSMYGEITIRGNFIRFVREDSRAIVKKKFGLAGDAYVEITKGSGAKLPRDGAALPCVKDTEITEMLTDMVEQLRSAVLPLIEQVRLAVEEYTKVAVELHRPEGNLQQLLARLNEVADGLAKGEGTAGQLLRDPALANELREITSTINQSLVEAQNILADVKKATAQLPPMAETIRGEVDELPGMFIQTQETLRETQVLIEAIQKHWLIRKYVDQTDPATRIPPSRVGPPEGGKP